MKLASLMRVLSDKQEICVCDENAPVDSWELYCETVDVCRRQWFRNGIVNVVLCSDDTVNVLIDVEYQKKRKERERDRAALHV